VLDGLHAPRAEAAAVADAIDLVTIGAAMSPGSRKYPCSECGNRSSTVRVAATRA